MRTRGAAGRLIIAVPPITHLLHAPDTAFQQLEQLVEVRDIALVPFVARLAPVPGP
jgi:hypothetical protein